MHVVGSDCKRSTWIFFGVLMVIMVSGGAQGDTSVHGVVSESVLLPCNCTNINLSQPFTWQKEDIKNIPIIMYNNSNNDTNYTGRVDLFLNERNNNCSLLLHNITADDQGKYKCSYWYFEKDYERAFVNLKIFEPVVTSSDGKRLFTCRVYTRNTNTEIRWRLNGTFLNNSFEINISSTGPMNVDGIYNFNSTLTARIDMTPEPECVPQDKTRQRGWGSPSPEPTPPHRGTCSESCIIGLIMLVLGLSLVPCLCWYFRRRMRGYGRAPHEEPITGVSSSLKV